MPDMSAPSIPNLLSLRGRGRGSRGRGRGRGQGGGDSHSSAPSHDSTIQGTDTDAAVSRMSAVDLGYLQDPFAEYFVQKPVGGAIRRLPIINRGTYTRTTALDTLITSFLSTTATRGRQLISLGAGTDTRPFKLFSQPGLANLIYHEIDFPEIASKKLRLVNAVPQLRNILRNPEAENNSWSSPNLQNGCQYRCHGLDLRDLLKDDVKPLDGIRTDVPTILISECCLCYLEIPQARGVINYFTKIIPNLAIIIYEPIHPNDSFGKQMTSNLAARRICMPTLDAYENTTSQKERLQNAGFTITRSVTIRDVWQNWVADEEKERVDGLEGLDEVEEWNLLADHYAVVWGLRGDGFQKWSEQWRCVR